MRIVTPPTTPTPVGQLLRQWRAHRRYSQLNVAIETNISTRHLSYVETGRSRPSSEMILRLAEHLEIPLRDRNKLLLAGGYAPAFPEHDLHSPDLLEARTAVHELLLAHEPYPAIAVDRLWNILDANAGIDLLASIASPTLLQGQVNALRLTLHPDGIAPHIINLNQWRASVLGSLKRSAEARDDDQMRELYDELAEYPAANERSDPLPTGSVHVPLRLRLDDVELNFLAIIATLGSAVDITLSELAIESFFPADQKTAEWLQRDGQPHPSQ